MIRRLPVEELPDSLQQALEPRVKRLGYLGEFFQCAAHQPVALLAFMEFTEALRASLPFPLVEVVSLTVGAATRNDYERHQHEQLCRAKGLDPAWIEAVVSLESDRLSPEEALAQRLVLALLADHGHGAEAEIAAAGGELGDAGVMAVMLLVGRYQAHSIVVNGLQLAPPVPSIFEADR